MVRSMVRRKDRCTYIVLLASLAIVTACSDGDPVSPASSKPDKRWALAWASEPSATVEYKASAAYAFTTGDSIRISRIGIGTYSVRFPGLATQSGWKETVAVSAYGAIPRRCRIASWTSVDSDLVAQVRCHDFTGALADSRFDILLIPAGSLPGRSAFAISPLTYELGPTVVDTSTSYNSAKQPITIERTNIGRYKVIFKGLARKQSPVANKEILYLTPFGDGAEWCKADSWVDMENDLQASIRCFSATGNAADGRFSIVLIETGRQGKRLGYVWADDFTAPASIPFPDYNFTSAGGQNSATRSSVGSYTITWAGIGNIGTSAETNLVNGFGGTTSSCQVESWGTNKTNVVCFDKNGNLVDAQFVAIWIE